MTEPQRLPPEPAAQHHGAPRGEGGLLSINRLATSAASASAQARYECFSNGSGGYECVWIPSDLDPGAIRDLDMGT
jgi:hypothetical protein